MKMYPQRTVTVLALAAIALTGGSTVAYEPVDIGSRRELFVDRLLFIDARPGVESAERFKALGGYPGPGDKRGKSEPGWGLFAFVSADGAHWTTKTEVIPYQPQWRHAFDSQNVSFWSAAEQQYVCYFRTWTPVERLRSISRTTSADFKTWSKPVAMNPNLPGEHLYTNQTHPYFRAPQIYIATPTRFVPDRGDAPGYDKKDVNATDILFMTTRAGATRYDRVFTEAFTGKPIPGFALDDCPIVYGDGTDLAVKWKNGRNLSSLAGQPVRLRFVMKECDLFSFRFQSMRTQ